jgi:thioredoxin-related protein
MKRIILALAIISAGTLTMAAQDNNNALRKPQAPAIIFDREKFDVARSPKDDLQSAVLKAQKENKRIILDVGGEWCSWCIHMDRFIGTNPELKKLKEDNYIWVKVNFSEENENKEFLAAYPEAKGYPQLYVLEKDGTLLKSQDTSELEDGKTYNLKKFTEFLQKWSPVKLPDTAAK